RALYRGLREAEESARQLREAEKLHAVGQLAGGVAHDFNNQLTAILGSAERLRARVGADPELSGAVQDIIQCSTRAADLTRQLLAFARKEPHRRDVVTVDPLVDEVVSLLRRGADKRVTIQTRLQAGESGRVLGDVSLLQNALLNLGLNACDAMSRGGCLTFETRCLGRAEIDDGLRTRLQEASRRAGGGGDAAAVCVRVVDDGEGMPPEVAERAFEPFFTTKERGTGMGLAASYGTVEAHGGAITIDSEPGRGTTVEVLLPATERPVEESIAPRASAPPPAVRVLLAEDEPAVGRSIVATLEALGCQVCWCKDGPETIERFAEDPEAFEVAMLDHAMPQMLGSDVAVRLAELRPGLPIVSVSGFRDGPDGSRAGPRQVFLPKPFTMEQLESALQRALAGRGRA
ncbi:MAG: ATP-binding protein, partial [Myxococcales bacterium]